MIRATARAECACCGDPCDFDSATIAISISDVPPCDSECKTGFLGGGDFRIVTGGASGGFGLSGSDGNVSFAQDARFLIDVYEPGSNCMGDSQQMSYGLLIVVTCDGSRPNGPLRAAAYITSGVDIAYEIFDLPETPGDGFDFDEVVEVPGCGFITVSL